MESGSGTIEINRPGRGGPAQHGAGLQHLRLGRIEAGKAHQDRVAHGVGDPQLLKRAPLPAVSGALQVRAVASSHVQQPHNRFEEAQLRLRRIADGVDRLIRTALREKLRELASSGTERLAAVGGEQGVLQGE
jgi:hypothetical protein